MKYEIKLSEDGKYLRVKVFETINGEMEKSMAEDAIKKARQHKIKKFLVDVRSTPNVARAFEQYQFAYDDMRQFGLDRDSRIAVLVGDEDKSHSFIEIVFKNAGYHCAQFSDEKSALEWLEE